MGIVTTKTISSCKPIPNRSSEENNDGKQLLYESNESSVCSLMRKKFTFNFKVKVTVNTTVGLGLGFHNSQQNI